MTEAGDPELIGRTIAGKYVVESYLGGGAMGAVYRAKQRALDRFVAVKVLHEDVAQDPRFVTRFTREAKAASRLDHPCSVRIVDFGEEPDGLLYIAMEYLEGQDLFHVMHQEGPLAPERIVRILMQVLAALAVAHDMGVVHRDLKPENIMILRGTDDEGNPTDLVKVCDFGIAKLSDPDDESGAVGGGAVEKLTTRGFLVGTPEYMSPEQCRGEKLDARSDLYAIGVILYQLLTGRMPFTGDSPIAVILKQISADPDPPHVVVPTAHRELGAVCMRALAKEREDRFASAREMRSALRAALGFALTVPADVPSQPPPAGERSAFGSAPTRRLASDAPQGVVVPPLSSAATLATPPPAATSLPPASAPASIPGPETGVTTERPRAPRRSPVVALVAVVALAAGAMATVGAFAVRKKTPARETTSTTPVVSADLPPLEAPAASVSAPSVSASVSAHPPPPHPRPKSPSSPPKHKPAPRSSR